VKEIGVGIAPSRHARAVRGTQARLKAVAIENEEACSSAAAAS
jgi:hypothetical protein